MNKNYDEALEPDEYYDTLTGLFIEPVFLEKFLKACVKAYALNKEQLQALEGCAQELLDHLNKQEYLDDRFQLSYDEWQKWHDDAVSNITRSISLLCEYGDEQFLF